MLNHFETLKLAGKLADCFAAGMRLTDPEKIHKLIGEAQEKISAAGSAEAAASERIAG
jgi:hypothetical protein